MISNKNKNPPLKSFITYHKISVTPGILMKQAVFIVVLIKCLETIVKRKKKVRNSFVNIFRV